MANRDEFFNRPTLKANFWEDNNNILGGRDILSQGTWLGINNSGKFIAITNYRDPNQNRENTKSRGEISKEYLNSNLQTHPFISQISREKRLFNGFNILLSDDGFETLYHYSNISDKSTLISEGFYGLSNHLFDTNWPKVDSGKKELAKIIDSGSFDSYDLIDMLQNETIAPDHSLPNTGISFDLERKLSPVFISMKGYGTRCSTVLLIDNNNQLSFLEVSYNEKKEVISEQRFNMMLKS